MLPRRLLPGLLWLLMWPCWAAQGTSSNLESFVDGIMEQAVVNGATVGATVALVQDGRLVMARGYGYADLTAAIPVQARVNSFRIGSITKVLGWMAVLQQVEAGRLDLDTDVNEYLRNFNLSSDFTDPVTLRHLMTHTAGFEDDWTRLFAGGPRQLGSLQANLEQQLPRRVRLPGTVTAYSNYGSALAGHIVANVSGQDWHDYVQANLLQPMRMQASSTRQPLPEPLAANRAKGYVKSADGFVEQGFSYIPLAPAGAASATAVDMARLMVELLNPGSTGVLSAESKAQLLGGAFVVDPRVNGMTLGMYQMSRGQAPAVGHDGSTMIFHSRMVLWPQARMGLFVSVNTDSGVNVVRALSDTLSARLGFDIRPDAENQAQGINNGLSYQGRYLTTRRNFSNATKLLAWVDSVNVLFDRGQEQLLVQDMFGQRRFAHLGGEVYQQVNGPARMVFAQNGRQKVLYLSDRPMLAYTAVEGAEGLDVTVYVLGFWLLLTLSVLLYWPLTWIWRPASSSGGGGGLTFIVLLSTAVVLAFFAQVISSAADQVAFMFSGISRLESRLWLPAVYVLLVGVQFVYLYRVWVKGLWWPLRRIHFTILLLAQIGLAWWFWQWNLLPEELRRLWM